MNHDLMTGMWIAGILMSLLPVGLGIAIGVMALRHWRDSRRTPAD